MIGIIHSSICFSISSFSLSALPIVLKFSRDSTLLLIKKPLGFPVQFEWVRVF